MIMSEIVRTDNGGYIDVSTIKAMQSYKNWGISALSHYKTKENMCYFWVDENGDVNSLSRQQKGAKAFWETQEEAQEAADRLFDKLNGAGWNDH